MGALSLRSLHRERVRSPGWFYAYGPVNLANGASSPLIALFMVIALHASLLEVGLLLFFTSLAAVPGAIFWGRLSDRLHRRRIFVLIGLASFAVTLPIMAVTRDPIVYFAANAVLGFMQAAGAATATVLIMESSHPREWPVQIGRFAQVSGIAFVGGLVVGAVWFGFAPATFGEETALELLFFIAAGLSAASVALGCITLKEGHHRVDRDAAVAALAHLGHSIVEKRHGFFVRFTHIASLRKGTLRGAVGTPIGRFSLGVSLLFTGFLVFNAPLPVFFLREAQLSQDLIFWVYVANSALAGALYGYAGRRMKHREPRALFLRASWARVVIYPMFAVAVIALGAGSPSVIIAVAALNALAGAAWAFINVGGSVVASNLAEPEAKGQAMGLYNAAIGAGSIAGALIGGVVAEHTSFLMVFLLSSAFIVAGALTVATVRVPHVQEEPRPAQGPSQGTHA